MNVKEAIEFLQKEECTVTVHRKMDTIVHPFKSGIEAVTFADLIFKKRSVYLVEVYDRWVNDVYRLEKHPKPDAK